MPRLNYFYYFKKGVFAVLLLKSENLPKIYMVKGKWCTEVFISLFKHSNDIADYSCLPSIFIPWSLDASHTHFSLLISVTPFISHMCIFPSTWMYMKCHVSLYCCEDHCFTSEVVSAHVLWANCGNLCKLCAQSPTLPLGEMQIRTFCSLFVFKYIHFSHQGSGQTPCLFSRCSWFVIPCKYISL